MANNMTNWDVEAQNIEQRRRYADALRKQSMEPINPGQLPGVPISPFQGLAKVFKSYTAGQTERKAAEDSRNLTTRRNQALADALRGAFEPVPGQPEQRGPFLEGLVKPAVPERQRTTQEISRALLGNPDTMNIGANLLVQDATSRNRLNDSMQTELFKHNLRMDPAYIAAQRQAKGGESPYFNPVQTAQGIYSFNARTGKMEKINAEGGPVIGSQSDPKLQANIAYGKKAGEERAKLKVEIEKSFPKARNTLASLNQQWSLVDDNIDRALNQIGPFTAGVGAWTKVVPASPAKDLEQTLETIKANIGFDKLQDMRANSPTGGALGQVSDFENKLLQSVKGSLVQSQSPAQLLENLKRVKSDLARLREEKKRAFDMDFKDVLQPTSAPTGVPNTGAQSGGTVQWGNLK